MFGMILSLSNCVGVPKKVLYPVPEEIGRPHLNFVMNDGVCLSESQMKELFTYVVSLETELDKAKVTIEIINKEK